LHHRRLQAEVLREYAHFAVLERNDTTARHSLVEAVDQYERLGMRRALAEVREELQRLEMSERHAF
jgi:hypothetical protein